MNIPSTMAGVRIEDNRLVYDTALPVPVPKEDEVLIRVHSAALNRADLFQVEGSYPPPEGASPLPGLEVSGHIVDTNEPVCALLAGGGYAEYAVAKHNHCLPIPDGISLEQAATLPEIYATIWLALMQTARLEFEETLLVHGGTSGIGIAAIQWAKAQDCEVYATARTPEKCNLIKQLGAHPINYTHEDFVEIVKQAGGADVVLDMVGGEYIDRNIKALRQGGRMVSLAFLQGAKTHISAGGLLLKNLSWSGVTLRGQPDDAKAVILKQLQRHVWPLIARGDIRPIVDSAFPLAEAEKAHTRMRESLHCGKIALQVCAH